MSLDASLPHGANRLDLGEVTIVFLKDKIVIAPAGSPKHYTLHAGTNSGEIDIHETTVDGSVKSWETLFTITRDNLALMMQELAPGLLASHRKLIHRLRPGWMIRTGIGAVLGLVPSDAALAAVTKRGPKRKLLFDQAKYAASIVIPEFIDDLYDLRDGEAFTLIDWRKKPEQRVGTGFKIRRADGRPGLVWIPDRAVRDLQRSARPLLLAAATKYGQFHKALPWR